MSEQNHTKAPWLLAEDGSHFVYALNDKGCNRFWLTVYPGTHGGSEKRTPDGEIMANARVIAAAPELLEALEGFLASYLQSATSGDWGDCNVEGDPHVAAARAAIAKARGK